MKIYLLITVLSLSLSLTSYALGLNDLSILIPIPAPNEISLMLTPVDSGNNGQLLSKSVFDRFFRLVADRKNNEIWTTQLKVIAIRIDPCFIEGVGPLKCRRQLRLVWQPVFLEGHELSTHDAAIHSFYEFNDEEFSNILSEWKLLAKTDEKLPLVIHPILQKEGLSGIHWNKLRSLILKYCGEEKLIRMTSMTVSGSDQVWIFSGFDIFIDKTFKEMVIPRIETTTQSITQSSFNLSHFWGALTPAPLEDLEFNRLIDDSMFFKKTTSEVDVKKAVRSFFSFENPKKHNTGTLDCASCHLANMTHQWAEINYPELKWDTDFLDVKYQSDINLENTTKYKVKRHQFRIFGYFGKEPAISQRAINETAEALKTFKGIYSVK